MTAAWENYEVCLLALMMWREARGQGTEGMAAVGYVAWNRHINDHRALGLIITDDAQFTSINPPKKTYDPQLDVWPTPNDRQFELALDLAGKIVSGELPDPTHGATHYYNPAATKPDAWFVKNIAQSPAFEPTAKLGAHVFFRPKPRGPQSRIA